MLASKHTVQTQYKKPQPCAAELRDGIERMQNHLTAACIHTGLQDSTNHEPSPANWLCASLQIANKCCPRLVVVAYLGHLRLGAC